MGDAKIIRYVFNTDNSDRGKRIDVFLGSRIDELSRSQIQKLFSKHEVFVNSAVCEEKKYKIKAGDSIEVYFSVEDEYIPKAENIELNIIYEDEDIVVIDKPRGMVVHPGAGNYNSTLVNALLYHVGEDLRELGEADRPGIVHRIDKDTSGILVVAKSKLAFDSLKEQFSKHSIKRWYYALVYNNFGDDSGKIDRPIGRDKKNRLRRAIDGENPKRAITRYEVMERFGNVVLIKAILETGRTHQIRVHLTSIGHPLVGDKLYGSKKDRFGADGQILHAAHLEFVHPRSGETVSFDSELPEYFIKAIEKAKKLAGQK